MSHTQPRLVVLLLLALSSVLARSAAAGRRETAAGSHFTVYVPPNNDVSNRYSAIVVTSVAGTAEAPNIVDLIDDSGDGDDDDTVSDARLIKGQSIVRYIKDGSVNDDFSGKWDGDLFVVDAMLPVTVMLVTDSDWQHTFAPAEDGLMRGQRFFLYANRTSLSPRDIDVFAYDNGTHVALYDVSTTTFVGSGITSVGARGNALFTDLDEGEDSMVMRGLGVDLLVAGRTYELIASRPVTVMYGALASLANSGGVRDGGTYVPGRNGLARARDFYFSIPRDPGRSNEQELRIIAAENNVDVNLWGFNTARSTWEPVRTWRLQELEHADVVGGVHDLYRVTSTGDVVVFEANWLETGSPGTSDVAAFVPGFVNDDGSQTFISYLGPPGRQVNTTTAGTFTHLYVSSRAGGNGATIDGVDADTGGTIWRSSSSVPGGGVADLRFTVAQWSALNRTQDGIRPYIRLRTSAPVAVCMANWNDNWMTYANSVVLWNPEVTVVVPPSIDVGGNATITGAIANTSSDDVSQVLVTLTLPPHVVFVSGDVNGAASIAQTTNANGGTQVDFVAPTLNSGETATLTTVVRPSAGNVGDLVGADISVRALDGSTTVSSIASVPLLLTSQQAASVANLEASPSTRRVDVSLHLRVPVGVTARTAVARATAATGPFVEVVGSVRTTIGPFDGAQTFTDTGVVDGTLYYYRVDASSAGGNSSAGPVTARPRDTEPPPTPTVAATAGDGRVDLVLGGSNVVDLAGYHIEFSRDGTRYTRLTTTPQQTTTFTRLGLDNGQAVAFRVVAVDTAGNASAASTPVVAVPQAAASRLGDDVVFFEDMIGERNNDWDYNDFIVRVATRVTTTGSGTSRIAIDYEPLARGAGYIHRVHQAVNVTGTWTATITRFAPGQPFVVVDTQQLAGAGAIDLVIYDDSRDALEPADGSFTNTTQAQGAFIDGSMVHVDIVLHEPTREDERNYTLPLDVWLEVPYLPAPNDIHLPRFGGASERAESGPLSGTTLPFALAVPTVLAAFEWAREGDALWNPFPLFVDDIVAPSVESARWHERGEHSRTYRKESSE